MEIQAYQKEYNEGVRRLCRISVSGNISIALEREPDYSIGSYVQCSEPEVYVVVENSKVIGVFNIGFRKLWINGKPTNVRYLCDLRVAPKWQTGQVFLRILRFYKALAKDELLSAQTIVFRDNILMHRFIEKRKSKSVDFPVPYYHMRGTLETFLLAPRKTKSNHNSYLVRQANPSDIENLQRFIHLESAKISHFPVYDLSVLGSSYYHQLKIEDFFICFENDKIVGTCFVWNQKSYKQTRISSYSKTYKWIRPLYNLLTSFTGRSKLPSAQSILDYSTIGCILSTGRNPDIFKSMLDQIVSDSAYSDLHYLMCSLDEQDPLNAVCKSYSKKRTTYGHYYLVNFQPQDGNKKEAYFYLEGARI